MKKVKRRWHAPDPTRYVLDGDEPDLEVYEDRQGDVKEGRSAGRGVKGLVAEEHNGSKSKGIVNKRDPEREKKLERMLRASLQQRSNVSVESQPAVRDIWGVTSSTATRKKTFQKESKLPAQAVLPKHGISYRPDSQAHMDQVAVATAFELQKKAERERWEKALQVPDEIHQLPDDDDDKTLNHYTNFLMGKPVDPAQVRPKKKKKNQGQQIPSGVDNDDEDDDDDDDDEDDEELPRKKKQTGLNKQYRKKMKKLRKGRIGREIDAVRSITRKILEEDAERKLKWKLMVKRKLQKAHFGAQRVGKRRFQEHRPPVVLSDDLPHSLRTVSSDAPLAGNLVVDTFRHLQRRNMIPTTVHHKFQSRHAVHRFVRPTDRRQWEAILETKFGIVESELEKQSRRQKPKKSSRKPKDDIDRILEADQERDEFL